MYVYKYDYRLLGAKLLNERVCPSVNHSETHSVTVILPNISKNNVRRTYCTKNKICMLILSMFYVSSHFKVVYRYKGITHPRRYLSKNPFT